MERVVKIAAFVFLGLCLTAFSAETNVEAQERLRSNMLLAESARNVINTRRKALQFPDMAAQRAFMIDLLDRYAAVQARVSLAEARREGGGAEFVERDKLATEINELLNSPYGRPDKFKIRAVAALAEFKQRRIQFSTVPLTSETQELVSEAEKAESPILKNTEAKSDAKSATPKIAKDTFQIYILKDGRRIKVAKVQDFGEEYVLKDESGALLKVAKSDVAEVEKP